MAKWTKEELLCNARGLDSGYLFINSSHPLAEKFKTVLQPGKTAKAPKTRLTDAAAYGCPGFTGAVRPPLSNELYSVSNEEESIPPPKSSDRAEFSSDDNLFTDPIASNASVCVAFSEPSKLSHKSILLPGAKPPKPCLTDADRVIHRPRINRGGGTIANMGGGPARGQSFQSGYGSMNISSYERDLAQRTGRANQMNQAGTRSWGSMEPSQKRPYQAHNPFQGRPNIPPPPPPTNRPPWQQQQQQQFGNRPPQQQQQQWQHQRPPNNQGYGGYQQPQHGYNGQQHQRQYHNNAHHRAPPHHQQGRNPHQQQQPNRHDFRAMNHQQGRGPNPHQRAQQQSQRANANVMSSLKAQLASTLNKNKRPK